MSDYATNWEQHFRSMAYQRGPAIEPPLVAIPPRQPREVYDVAFGTVMGYYSVAELIDLIAAKDASMHNLVERFNEVKDLPLDLTSFTPAYNSLLNRYSAARGIAQKAVDNAAGSVRPLNMVIADKEYKGLLTALNARWQEYTWSPGDGSLDDLFNQVIGFGATGKNDEPIPQPKTGSDVEFNLLARANQAIHTIESAATLVDTKHLIIYGIVGGAFAIFVLPRLMALTPGGMLLKHR